jgi:hypothetical protein
MANKQRGEVDVQLDKKRTFKFTNNAMVNLEDALGISMMQFGETVIGFRTMVTMVWAALLHSMPELTFEEAAQLMDHGDFTDISAKVTEALSLFFPSEEEQAKKL